LLLARNLPMSKAKVLQAKFYKMNSRIELEKCKIANVKLEPKRTKAPQAKSDAADRRPPPMKNESPSQTISVTRLVTLLIILVASIGLFIFQTFVHEDPATLDLATNKPSREVAGLPEVKLPDEKTGEQVFTVTTSVSPRGYFNIRAVRWGDDKQLRRLGERLEVDLSRLGSILGSVPDKKFKIKIDGKEPFGEMISSFGLATSTRKGQIVISGAGLSMGDARLRPILMTLVSREILRGWGGDRLPGWFEDGFALYLMRRVIQGVYEPINYLNGTDQYLDDESWNDLFEEGSPRAYAQAASFVGYLIDTQQIESFIQVARDTKAGENLEHAIQKTYGLNRSNLMDGWFIQLKH